MILTDGEIFKAREDEEILIEPFHVKNVNSNSYDVSLGKYILQYIYPKSGEFDIKDEWNYKIIEIPEEGLVLQPGQLYLGVTNEAIGSDVHVPILEGRSSMGRAGIQIHITAGFGDLGFKTNWTLEIHSLLPVRIYPNMRVGQIYFLRTKQNAHKLYMNRKTSKYYNQSDKPMPTKIFKDFKEEDSDDN